MAESKAIQSGVFRVSMCEIRDNADAHLKRQVMGREVVVAITDGRLDFGPWEQIFLPARAGATPALQATMGLPIFSSDTIISCGIVIPFAGTERRE